MSDAPTATGSSWLSCLLCALFGLVIGNLTSTSHYRFLSNALLSRFVVNKEEQLRQLHAQENGASEDDASEEIEFTTVMVIVLLLILLTIGFEVMKHRLEKKSNKNTEPIIEKLFGEMTVLGFLSIFTYVVTKTGVFGIVSNSLFGDEEEVHELFESVHYCIFFIMVCFVVQVLVLVREAIQTEERWLELDRKCRDPGSQWDERAMKYNSISRAARFASTAALNLIPGVRNAQREMDADLLLFKGLRDEFILERSQEYPFEPCPESSRVGQDFNFGRYLSMCLGHTLTHVVEVSNWTWSFYAIMAVMYYAYCLLVGTRIEVLAWTWVAAGWGFFIFNIYFERHLLQLRKAFVSKELVRLMSYNPVVVFGETTPLSISGAATDEDILLIPLNNDDQDLPAWCDVDLEYYMELRSRLMRCFSGGVPTHQQALYWMDRKGPTFYLHILQINLIFTGLYCAMQILSFLPAMYEMPWYQFAIYFLLALAPVLLITLNKKHLVATLSQVCCMGPYRKPHVVSDVLREEKTARAVRTFIIVDKMRRFAAQPRSPRGGNTRQLHYSESFDALEVAEVCKTFEAFDTSGDGRISIDEFRDLMSSLGAAASEDDLQQIIRMLDEDGNGEISKDEFLQWYSQEAENDNLSPHERAKFLFGLFDTNHIGEITIAEFKRKLDALCMGFTVDEVGGIVNELDEDKSGSIGLQEFEHLLEKYYPKELNTSNSIRPGKRQMLCEKASECQSRRD